MTTRARKQEIGATRHSPSRLRLASVFAVLLLLPGAGRATDDAPLPSPTTVKWLAFGSCADQRLPPPIWQPILTLRPQLFLMLGDNVYGDVSSQAMTELITAYATVTAQPGFSALRASGLDPANPGRSRLRPQ